MAVISNAIVPSGPRGSTLEVESIAAAVEMVARDDVPALSNTSKGEETSLNFDWGTEDIGTISVPTPAELGYVAATSATVADRRLRNWFQLIYIGGAVSHTQDAIATVDGVKKRAREEMKLAIKHQRQMNALWHASQKFNAAPATATAYPCATWKAYTRNIADLFTAPGTLPTGDGSDIYVAGTTGNPFVSIDPFNDIMVAARATRGMPNTVYGSPLNKAAFSRLPDASIAENNYNLSPGSDQKFEFAGSVDVYKSDFGPLRFIDDIDCPNDNIGLVDHQYLEMVNLPGMYMNSYELGKRGSAVEFVLESQISFKVTLPEAMGWIVGIV